MRCQNCGWQNQEEEEERCEKCNAPINDGVFSQSIGRSILIQREYNNLPFFQRLYRKLFKKDTIASPLPVLRKQKEEPHKRCPNCGWQNPTETPRCQKCDYPFKAEDWDASTTTFYAIPKRGTIARTIRSSSIGLSSPQTPLKRSIGSPNIAPSSSTIVIKPGETIDFYKIESLLGEGSYSKVFKVFDTITNQFFAMKVLKLYGINDHQQKEILKKRFEQEFRLGSIDCPHLVSNYNKGEINGNPFIIQDYAEGGTVAQYLKPDLSFDFINTFSLQVLQGLEALHKRGIIHRDLKPSNVLVQNKIFKLGDFGISAYLNNRMTRRKEANDAFGTYPYIPPEGANTSRNFRHLSPKFDIFSFGVSAFELITGGKLPFGDLDSSEQLGNYIRNAQNGSFRSVSYYRKETPEWWENLIAQCLEPDIKKRIESAAVVRSIIEAQLNEIPEQFAAEKYEYDLFISYAHVDYEFAEKVQRVLAEKGLKTFFADESLKKNAGESFFQVINDVLSKAQHFLLICSENTLSSSWVKAEYETFFNEFHIPNTKNRRFIPLAPPDFDKKSLPPILRRFQIANTPGDVIQNIKPSIFETMVPF